MAVVRLLQFAFVSLVVLAPAVRAQEPGHGMAAEKLGTVHFVTSCRASTAPGFDRAIALLHSFEFRAAIAGFSAVLAADSSCAIAHWGIALSRWGNPFGSSIRPAARLRPGRDEIERADRATTAAPRERAYIAAAAQLFADYEHISQRARIVAYERAMGALAAEQPADTEAAIFHALALAASAPLDDKTYANQLKAVAILDGIAAQQPDHPGLVHYLIHSHDIPALAGGGLSAARRYASIAPSAPHALHMPSHIFTRVGAWEESIATNTKSVAAARREGSIAEALHASDYMMYAYLQTGQDRAAKGILDGLPALATQFDPNAIGSAAGGSAGVYALAAIPARWALERGAWAEAAALDARPSAFVWADAVTWFARALGAARMGDASTARAALDTLRLMQARLTTDGEADWAEKVEISRLSGAAWVAFAGRDTSGAIALAREAAVREERTEKSAISPGPLAPARELLGDLLLEVGQPAPALAEYEATLKTEPNRLRALLGAMRAASLAGDRATAARYRAQVRATCPARGPGDRPGCRGVLSSEDPPPPRRVP